MNLKILLSGMLLLLPVTSVTALPVNLKIPPQIMKGPGQLTRTGGIGAIIHRFWKITSYLKICYLSWLILEAFLDTSQHRQRKQQASRREYLLLRLQMIKQLKLWDFVESLHPTPAVAGQPKEDAISFIRELEEHHREYYTGYLGPVGPRDTIDLFVNLRSVKITPGFLAMYVGGGITLESIPEDEWEETELKAASTLNIIQSCNTTSW